MAKDKKFLPSRIELEAGEYAHSEILGMLESSSCQVSGTAEQAIKSEQFASKMGMGVYEVVVVKGHLVERHLEDNATSDELLAWVKEKYDLDPCPSDLVATLILEGASILKEGVYVVCDPITIDDEPWIFSAGVVEVLHHEHGEVERPWIEMERCSKLRFLSLSTMDLLFVRAR